MYKDFLNSRYWLSVFLCVLMVATYFVGIKEVEAAVKTFTTSDTWTPPGGVTSVEILVVGGGGSGGAGTGAGGGAGGLIYISSFPVTDTTYTITVGAGGTNDGVGTGTDGSNSSISGDGRTLTALGGGHGDATENGNNGFACGTGGSGGGAASLYAVASGCAATQPANTSDGIDTYNGTGFGNAGGDASGGESSGGGGAGGAGATSATGAGGQGKQYSISGSSQYYAAGGSGARNGTAATNGIGGYYLGNNHGSDGVANTGSGGGGGWAHAGGTGGDGGSGVVIISYFGGASTQTTFTTPVYVTEDASVTGTLAKGSGSFVMDHPLDPENKLLYHSFVESPDVKNIYDGIAELDDGGQATVELPNYFEALNGNESARFLLTPIGAPAPNLYVEEDGVSNNSFTIAGGPPGTRVSWQVTGIRQDPYILANPIEVEVEKGPDALVPKGELLFPEYWDWVTEPVSQLIKRFNFLNV